MRIIRRLVIALSHGKNHSAYRLAGNLNGSCSTDNHNHSIEPFEIVAFRRCRRRVIADKRVFRHRCVDHNAFSCSVVAVAAVGREVVVHVVDHNVFHRQGIAVAVGEVVAEVGCLLFLNLRHIGCVYILDHCRFTLFLAVDDVSVYRRRFFNKDALAVIRLLLYEAWVAYARRNDFINHRATFVLLSVYIGVVDVKLKRLGKCCGAMREHRALESIVDITDNHMGGNRLGAGVKHRAARTRITEISIFRLYNIQAVFKHQVRHIFHSGIAAVEVKHGILAAHGQITIVVARLHDYAVTRTIDNNRTVFDCHIGKICIDAHTFVGDVESQHFRAGRAADNQVAALATDARTLCAHRDAVGLGCDSRVAHQLNNQRSVHSVDACVVFIVGGVDVGIAQRQHAGILRLPVRDALAELFSKRLVFDVHAAECHKAARTVGFLLDVIMLMRLGRAFVAVLGDCIDVDVAYFRNSDRSGIFRNFLKHFPILHDVVSHHGTLVAVVDGHREFALLHLFRRGDFQGGKRLLADAHNHSAFREEIAPIVCFVVCVLAAERNPQLAVCRVCKLLGERYRSRIMADYFQNLIS